MTKNTKETSAKVASQAGTTLQSSGASDIARSLAASVLAQRGTAKQTGAGMETVASEVLKSPKYSDATKALAASLVSQSNKKR